jgi:hypothetical protein
VVTWAVFGAIYGSISYCLIAKPNSLRELVSGAIGFGLLWAVITTIGLVGPWVKGGTVGPFLLGAIRLLSMGALGNLSPSYGHQSEQVLIFWGLVLIGGMLLPWSKERTLRLILLAIALAGTLSIAIMYVLDGAYGAVLVRFLIGNIVGILVGLLAGTIAWTAEEFVTERKQSENKPRKVASEVEVHGSEVNADRSRMSVGRLAVVIVLGAIAVICYLIFA